MHPTRTLLSFFILIGGSLTAAHLPGGNITYECLGGNEYEVTLTLFRDCSGAALMDNQELLFASDCGLSFTMTNLPVSQGVEVSQLCPADLPNSSCNGGTLPGIEVYQVVLTVPLSPCNLWRISWKECCRNTSQNLVGEPGTYIEARLNNLNAPCNNSPVFTQDVIPYVCLNEPVSYNLAVTEPDGHELRYRLIDARQLQPPVPVNYMGGLTGAEPYPGLQIDSLTGQITFTPTGIGMIFIVVQVDEYLSDGTLAGSAMRDFPFVVIDCPNAPPDPESGEISQLTGQTITSTDMGITICTYGDFCFNATITDPDPGQTITLSSNISTVLPAATFTSSGSNPVNATICLEEGSLDPGSYGFVITAEDDACPNTGLTTFAYSITVLPDEDADCLGTRIEIAPADPADWSIWPVPANEVINISHGSARPGHLRIHDLDGRLVHEALIPSGTTSLDANAMAPGAYMVSLLLEGREMHRRIIISP